MRQAPLPFSLENKGKELMDTWDFVDRKMGRKICRVRWGFQRT